MGSENPESFFSSADRIYVTHDLLNRTRFGSKDCVGIDIALKKGVYAAAYPLHEVEL